MRSPAVAIALAVAVVGIGGLVIVVAMAPQEPVGTAALIVDRSPLTLDEAARLAGRGPVSAAPAKPSRSAGTRGVATIVGRVVGPRGDAAVGARVAVQWLAMPSQGARDAGTARTDVQGHFAIAYTDD